jgi:hypothetical protein
MDQANDFVKDITSAFIKIACNRKVDDAGKSSQLKAYSCGERAVKEERRQEEGEGIRLVASKGEDVCNSLSNDLQRVPLRPYPRSMCLACV